MALFMEVKVKEQLEAMFNKATMKIILGNDDFVDAINQFFKRNSNLPYSIFTKDKNPDNEGGYDPYGKFINITPPAFNNHSDELYDTEFKEHVQLKALTILAHELGHALSSWQEDFTPSQKNKSGTFVYPSLSQYIQQLHEEEGKAVYNQYKLISSLDIPDEFKRDMVYYLEADNAVSEKMNLYGKLDELRINGKRLSEYFEYEMTWSIVEESGSIVTFFYDKSNDKYYNATEIFQKVGETFSHAGAPGVRDEVGFNYDENFTWWWLNSTRDTSFFRDFMEAHGQTFTNNEQALKAIKANQTYLYEIKILLNGYNNGVDSEGKVHKYVGTDDTNPETLTAKEGGSVLGNADQFGHEMGEVLWGGKGVDVLKGGSNSDVLIGGDGNDILYGYGGNDRLAGNEGDDHLHGGSGLNHLYGGAGKDTYYIGEGIDVISDRDRDSVIMWNGKKLDKIYRVSGNLYADFNGLSYYNYGSRMLVFQPGGGLIASLEGFDFLMQRSSGGSNYGLTVVDNNPINDIPKTVMPGTNPGLGGDVYHTINSSASQKGQYVGIISGSKDDLFTGGYGNEVVDMGAGNDIANGGLGHDVIDGGSGNDVLLGSAFTANEALADQDNDRLIGGEGRDLIYGGIGNDTIICGTSTDELGDSEGQGDWAVGGSGNDLIFGGKDDDFLNGGAGADTIYGGGGHDIILGDGNLIFGYKTKNQQGFYTSTHTWNGGAASWSHMHGTTFANYVDQASFNWSATITNGERPDFSLNTELALRAESERLAQGGGNDIIFGGAGKDWIAGQTGDDFIDGGDDDDIIYGDDIQATAGDGNDTIYGGDGSDLIFGGGGNDIIYADFSTAAENAAMKKDTEDRLYGGTGDDTLYAGKGNDKLYGEADNDKLHSSAYGSHLLDGGTGRNSYFFDAATMSSTGHDTIADADGLWSIFLNGRDLKSYVLKASGDPLAKTWTDAGGAFTLKVSGNNVIISCQNGAQAGKTITIQNGANHQAFQDLNFPEKPENRAPEIAGSIADQSGRAGQAISFVIPASMFSDPDGDPLSFRLTLRDGSALPSWLTFNPATLTVSGTAPGAFDQTLRLIVSDGQGGESSADFTLTINASANQTPEVTGSLSDQTIKAGQLLGFDLGEDVFTDPDGDKLTYRAALSDGRELPGWLSFNKETGKFSGTPPLSFGGRQLALQVWASDGQGESAPVTVTINIEAASEYNEIEGTDGNDSLTGTSGNDHIFGGAGDDIIKGGEGDDYLEGGEGNDELHGGPGNNILDGGTGDDKLYGGANDNIYVFGRGYGHDHVLNVAGVSGRVNTVRLLGLSAGEVEFYTEFSHTYGSLRYDHVFIKIKDTGETLKLDCAILSTGGIYQSGNPYGIQVIEFGDGTSMDWADLIGSGLLSLNGGEGDDVLRAPDIDMTIYGGEGNDTLYGSNKAHSTLDGGAGDDKLYGGSGDNTFVFGRGYGNDHVLNVAGASGRTNTVRLSGLSAGEVEFYTEFSHTYGSLRYDHVFIKIKDTGETLKLDCALLSNGGIYQPGNPYGVQVIEFGDGSSMDWADLIGSGLLSQSGGEGDDVLRAPDIDMTVYGGAGNDILYGSNKAHSTLDGGTGNDKLYGGSGDNTFVFGRGYGHDHVLNVAGDSGRTNTVRLLGLSAGDVEFYTEFSHNYSSLRYDHVFIKIKNTGETLKLDCALLSNGGIYQPGNPYGIQVIEFGDGSTMDWADLVGSGLLSCKGTDADDVLRAPDIDMAIYGGAGNDIIYGSHNAHTTIDGGAGNDTLYGGKGDNTFVFGRGYGHDMAHSPEAMDGRRNVVRLDGLNLEDVEFLCEYENTYSGYNRWDYVVIRIRDTGETLKLKGAINNVSGIYNTNNLHGYSAIEFGDGSVMEWNDLMNSGLLKMEGTAGNDSFGAPGVGTVMYGNEGNDFLTGGAGDDTYMFKAGDGQDSITNTGGGDDLLKFEDVNPADLWFGQSGNNLVIGLIGTADKVTVNNWYAAGDYKIDRIEAGGLSLVESQVAQMVQAMAAIGAPAGAGGLWTDEQRDALVPVISSYWLPKN